jgi:hypothetical protein
MEIASANADRQATESSLHAFYQSQTERIVSLRVASLKEDVEHYEKVIKDEHEREVATLRAEFAARNKELKEKWVGVTVPALIVKRDLSFVPGLSKRWACWCISSGRTSRAWSPR